MSKKMPPGPLSAMSEARQSVDIRIPASSELNNLVRLGQKVLADIHGKGGEVKNTRLGRNLRQIVENIAPDLTTQLDALELVAPAYNLKSATSLSGYGTNGFFCFVRINRNAVRKLTQSLLQVDSTPRSRQDPKGLQELEYWIKYISKVMLLNRCCLELHEELPNGQLFPDKPDLRASPKIMEWAERIGMEDFSIFYGRGAGIHMTPKNLLVPLMFAQAMFADVYNGSLFWKMKTWVSNGFMGLAYLYNLDYLGSRIYANSRQTQVYFAKTYFGMSEMAIVHRYIKFLHSVATDCTIKIPPQKLQVKLNNGSAFTIPVPNSNFGPRSLGVKLISPFRTKEMVGSCISCTVFCRCIRKTPSPTILFHVHGGGFIAQTSQSHESYLRVWATKLGVPILSVDYTTAPEGAFPRPVEEVMYAYAWMRNNFGLLGTTGENVFFVGDSAGGNLVTGLTSRCIELNIPGPKALLLFYPSMLAQTYPSPSRLMAMFDPMASFPMLLRALNSYSSPGYSQALPMTYEDELQYCLDANHDPLLSPLMTPNATLAKFPRTLFISTDLDPCLDETITMANKLMAVGCPEVQLEVVEGYPHGFLSMNFISNDCQKMVEDTLQTMQDFIRPHC